MTSLSLREDVTQRRGGRKERILHSLKAQLKDVDLWRASAAEFLATFILLFIVCITHMIPSLLRKEGSKYSRKDISSDDSLQINVGVALTYATLIQCFENISGGHMNPAISVAMLIAGHISSLKALVYSIAQVTGAFSAVALCYGMIPNPSSQASTVSTVNENLSALQGFGIEVLQTLILAVTWLATYLTSKSHLGSSALPVGIAYLANSLWAGQLTGSSTNPARSLAPAVLSNHWKNLWLYIIGPLAGSIVGALLYTHVFVTMPKKHGSGNLAVSGRSAEGESVQSDQESSELLPYNNVPQHHQTTNFSNTRKNSVELTQLANNGSLLHSVCIPQQVQRNHRMVSSQPSPCLSPGIPAVTHYNSPRGRNLHQALTLSVQKMNKMQPLHYSASTTPNSANVTLTRSQSRTFSRPNTACGALLTPNGNTNESMNALSRVHDHAAKPSVGYRKLSVTSEPFSESSKILINNSVL